MNRIYVALKKYKYDAKIKLIIYTKNDRLTNDFVICRS